MANTITKISDGMKSVQGKPQGFVVREYVNPKTNRSTFSLGIYVSPKTFVSVSLDYRFKDKLIPLTSSPNDEYKYYNIPNDLEVSWLKFTTKAGDERISIVPVDSDHPASFIICMAHGVEKPAYKILDINVPNEVHTLRNLVDRNREFVVAIMADDSITAINDADRIEITTGIPETVGPNVIEKHTVVFSTTVSPTTEIDHADAEEVIAIDNDLDLHQVDLVRTERPAREPRKFNKKPFNNKKENN